MKKSEELILINAQPYLTRVLIARGKRVEQFFVESQREVSLVGNVYLGRIVNVLKGIDAAFVDIGIGRNGFLPFEQVDETYVDETVEEEKRNRAGQQAQYRVGQEVIVQVIKPGSPLKGVKLTTRISLPGRFLVLMPFSTRRAISRRIEQPEERKRLAQTFNQLLPEEVGYIIRTAAEKKESEQLKRDVRVLLDTWNSIKNRASRGRAPRLLWQELDLATSVLRDYAGDSTSQIVVDSDHLFKKLRQYLRTFMPEMLPALTFHRSRMPLFAHFQMEKQIESFLEPRVDLPSGGYLLFDESETLNSIDINTGGSVRRNLEETIFNTNLEAAREIPRQISVRNLSGLIVIDFIDMRSEAHRRHIFEVLEKALEEDKARTKILHISRLGLVEMSREKVGLSLRQLLLENCPHCHGTGRIKSTVLAALGLKNELMVKLITEPRKKFSVALSESLARFIRENRVLELNFFERKRVSFHILPNVDPDYFQFNERS
ncbi:MAG TPA: Rne/Rng family ribonuclease [bacterium]|nr:Rne/Rng family ribonuclease [bacterium]HPP11294.1 Rne/Rng family ribonuclease [bacterium]